MNYSTEYFSIKNLWRDTAENKEMVEKMLQIFLSNAKDYNETLRISLSEKNYNRIGEICHKMIPAYKHLEVESITPNLIAVENSTIKGTLNASIIPKLINEIITRNELVIKEIKETLDKSFTNN